MSDASAPLEPVEDAFATAPVPDEVLGALGVTCLGGPASLADAADFEAVETPEDLAPAAAPATALAAVAVRAPMS